MNIKFRKSHNGKQTFWTDETCDPVVHHCLDGWSVFENQLNRDIPILKAHNIDPILETTMEEGAEVIYRVSDGVKFIWDEVDGAYYHQDHTAKLAPYDFDMLRSYFGAFTSNKSEIGLNT